MFNAAEVHIYNSNLISADTTTHNHAHYDRDPLEGLKPHVAQGALFNSNERYDPPKCHPETRGAVLRNIDAWARADLHAEYPILWLRGAAGAGKSAIAQTLSERWSVEETQMLAASFFFSRTAAGRNQSRYFIATIAYQLAHSMPMTRRYIERAVSDDWRLFDKPLQEQITALIVHPLTAPLTEIYPTKTIVIDGLDECCIDYPNQDHEAQQKEILDSIALASQHLIPIRFLIASRPERQIRDSFGDKPLSSLVYQITLDNSHNPDADIELFLRFSFQEIRQKYEDIEGDWPSEQTIRILVTKSSGHFIYASTVARYVSNPRGRDPKQRLEIILGLTVPQDMLRINPFAQLDALYSYIMASVHPDSLGNVLRMFGILTDPAIFNFKQPFKDIQVLSIGFLAKLLFTNRRQIYCDLVDLHSILEVPSSSHAAKQPVKFIHASFGEFLTSPARSGPFYIDPKRARLQSCILISKHVIISAARVGENAGYDHHSLYRVLVYGVKENTCPPSKELRTAIHAIVGTERVYNKNVKNMGMEVMNLKRVISPRQNLSWSDQLILLDYLECCNIEAIEESYMHRWLMNASLTGQKIRIQSLIILRYLLRLIVRWVSQIPRAMGSVIFGAVRLIFSSKKEDTLVRLLLMLAIVCIICGIVKTILVKHQQKV